MTPFSRSLRATLATLALCASTLSGTAQDFRHWFADSTLRADYTFAGDATHTELSLAELSTTPHWAGRRLHLDSLLLAGNAQIQMTDSASGRVIYRTSFSTLFQEWQHTDEARHLRRSFENPVLLPMPRRTAWVRLTLFDSRRQVTGTFTHLLQPADILIRRTRQEAAPHRYIHRGGSSAHCIDVAIVAEGYTAAEQARFYHDAERATQALFAHEPFKHYKDRFNILAVALPSAESGVSIPHDNHWPRTALGSHFDTFYSARYLTTLRLRHIHDALAPLPYEHLIILANTPEYGGGGIFNQYTLASAHHPMSLPVIVHEFGHSFGGLGDEYAYDNSLDNFYPSGVEPWEPNLTTLTDFASKWQDMLAPHTPVPTPPDSIPRHLNTKVGVYEGAGYQLKGVFRPVQECRMKVNNIPEFCPVCRRALTRLIHYYTGTP